MSEISFAGFEQAHDKYSCILKLSVKY